MKNTTSGNIDSMTEKVPLKLIKTSEEYDVAINVLKQLAIRTDLTQMESDYFDVLSTMIGKYEDEHYPIDLPDPISMIKYVMDNKGLTRKDLEPIIGSRSKVSEVLNGKRPLSLNMIRALHTELKISYDVLIQEPTEIKKRKTKITRIDRHIDFTNL